jgi:hypothetical protein
MLDSEGTNGVMQGRPADGHRREWAPPHTPEKAANGCDQPCPFGTFYHCCILGPHDGPHYCDQNHRWS